MSSNGRRAWREWMRKANPRRKLRPPTHSICRLAREGRRHIGPIPPATPKPFTPRSLVGMTQGARKRAARAELTGAHQVGTWSEIPAGIVREVYRGPHYRIGQKLRPCPGCCACWGHRISSAYGEIAECCGPQTSGKRKSQIKAMRKWQETLADNCDGSGVLPARRA